MHFYVVSNPRFNDDKFSYGEQPDDFNKGSALKCEECGNYLTMLKWLPPFNIKVSKNFLGDFIFGTYPGFIVSSKFKSLYEKAGLSGIIEFNSVTLYYEGKHLEVEYYYPEIVLSDAKVDLDKSGIEYNPVELCPKCQKGPMRFSNMKGLFFTDENKLLYDVFNNNVVGREVVSENFKIFIERNNISNLSLIEATNYKPSWVF